MPIPESEILFKNANGVIISKRRFLHGHCYAINALCACKKPLILAPRIFNPHHKKDDPIMVCNEYGEHSYKFSELITGRQLSLSLSEEKTMDDIALENYSIATRVRKLLMEKGEDYTITPTGLSAIFGDEHLWSIIAELNRLVRCKALAKIVQSDGSKTYQISNMSLFKKVCSKPTRSYTRRKQKNAKAISALNSSAKNVFMEISNNSIRIEIVFPEESCVPKELVQDLTSIIAKI